jgi:hypothetical protein
MTKTTDCDCGCEGSAATIATAATAALQMLLGASSAASLSYLQAVRQSNHAATLELATLSASISNLLGTGAVPRPEPLMVTDKQVSKTVTRDVYPPGYPVVT